MRINDSALRVAALRIFMDYNVPANGRLSLQDFHREWSRLHVRGSDYERAIDLLEATGDLCVTFDEGTVYVEITELGLQRATSIPTGSAKGAWQYLSGEALFQLAAHRRAGRTPEALHGRRRADRMEEAARAAG